VSDEQVRQRRENLEALRELGVDTRPYRYDATHHAEDVLEGFDALAAAGTTVSLAGRVVALRGHGKSTFIHLQDRTARVQVYFKLDVLGEEAYRVVRLLDLGDWVGVSGPLFRTRTGEITVEARALTFLAKCLRPLPEKWHGLRDVEIRYRQRYLDLIVNSEVRSVFEVRAALIRSLRSRLDAAGFLEVETPVLQPVYGGAFARPFVTHHEALDMDLYLRISNELYLKRLIVGGLERVYEIARDFRNEGIDRTHNPEFSMLEFYQAFADYEDMMRFTEELVAGAVMAATGGPRVEYEGNAIDFTPPWSRKSYFEALREATGLDLAGSGEEEARGAAERLGIDVEGKVGRGQILDEIFSETVQPGLVQPVFITGFPVELSPLARRHRDQRDVVERFELFTAGFELANAFSEQNDPDAQEEAFRRQAELREAGDLEAQVTDHDYLRALRLGMPPTGGVGIGIDRLCMIATGSPNIREVILFPQLRPETPGSGEESDDGGDTPSPDESPA